MVCIYCGHETEVVNSRKRGRLPSVWRRRVCKQCVAQFTTLEQPDYTTALLVEDAGYKNLKPFSRDQLFLSIYKSLGHRSDALKSSTALTETIIGKLLNKKLVKNGVIDSENIAKTSYDILKRFDKTAATFYRAYHKS
jgi:transcriptional regulator NrdR family protein